MADILGPKINKFSDDYEGAVEEVRQEQEAEAQAEAEAAYVPEPTVELYSLDSDQFMQVPESQAEEALRTRRFSYRRGSKVNVTNPDGDFGTIPSENIFDALDNGYKLDLESAQVDRELERKYGNKPTEAFLGEAASSLSVGASDQILVKAFGVDPERLREVREREAAAATAGAVAGIVGPLIATLGSSAPAQLGVRAGAKAVAKGAAKKAGAGVIALNKGAAATEKIVEQAIKKALKDTGQKEFAKRIVEKSLSSAAGGIVEGAAISMGDLLSENALGNVELNAENLIAAAKMGALWGGATGGVFGGLRATAPKIKSGMQAGAKFTKNAVDKAVDSTTSKSAAALKILGISPTAAKDISEDVINALPQWLKKKELLEVFQTSKSFTEGFDTLNRNNMKRLDDIYDQLDNYVRTAPASVPLPTIRRVALDAKAIARNAEDAVYNALGRTKTVRKKTKMLREIVDHFDELSKTQGRITGSQLRQTKQFLQELQKNALKSDKTVKEVVQGIAKVAEGVRNSIDDLANGIAKSADSTAANIGRDLLEANFDAHVIQSVRKHVGAKFQKDLQSSFIDFGDYITGGMALSTGDIRPLAINQGRKFMLSDFKNRIVLLKETEEQTRKITNAIGKAAKGFIKAGSTAAQAVNKAGVPVTTSLIVDGSLDQKAKKPKNRKEAFKLVRKQIQERVENPEQFIDRVQLRTTRLRTAAPQMAEVATQRALTAVGFLNDKLPKDTRTVTQSPFNKREFEPSAFDMAKFERYFAAVQDPMSVVRDMERGVITREGVEALKVVYPMIFAELQNSVLEQVAEQGEQMPYTKRLQLGLLFEVDTDASLQGDNISGLQGQFLSEGEKENIQVQERAAAGGVVNTTTGSLQELDKASRVATPLSKSTLTE